MERPLTNLARCNRGSVAIEYGLLASLIAVGVMAGVSQTGTALSQSLASLFQPVGSGPAEPDGGGSTPPT